MDDAKKIILARRARLVAAAMAGAAIAGCDKPRPCLDQPPLPTTSAEPQACLKMALPAPRDAGADDAAAPRDGAPDAKKPFVGPPGPPRTCLTM